MSNHNEQEEVKKRCPFNNEWCGNWCPLYVKVRQEIMGRIVDTDMCVFVSSNLMISQINQKTQTSQTPQQGIQIPKFLRG